MKKNTPKTSMWLRSFFVLDPSQTLNVCLYILLTCWVNLHGLHLHPRKFHSSPLKNDGTGRWYGFLLGPKLTNRRPGKCKINHHPKPRGNFSSSQLAMENLIMFLGLKKHPNNQAGDLPWMGDLMGLPPKQNKQIGSMGLVSLPAFGWFLWFPCG